MTSDGELLKRLEKLVILDEVGSDNPLGRQAAARIRELEAEIKTFQEMQMQSDRNQSRMVDRICELEAGNKSLSKMIRGVADGTHVIVPVEPTKAMIEAALMRYTGGYMSRQFDEIYCAMIRAAQPGATD